MKFNIKKHLPIILTGLGVVGSAVVGVSAGIAQHKVEEELKSDLIFAENDKTTVVKTYAKHYWPTAIIFALTSGCIIGSNRLSQRQYKQLLGAYAGLGAGFAGYRGAVIEKYGEEVDKELMEAAAVFTSDTFLDLSLVETPGKKLLFYEPISNTFFRAYERDVILAEYHFNRNFCLKGSSNVSELLYFLGIKPTEKTDKLGWDVEYGYYWVDLCHIAVKRPGRETYYEISYLFSPEEEYDEYYNKDGYPQYADYQTDSYVGNV